MAKKKCEKCKGMFASMGNHMRSCRKIPFGKDLVAAWYEAGVSFRKFLARYDLSQTKAMEKRMIDSYVLVGLSEERWFEDKTKQAKIAQSKNGGKNGEYTPQFITCDRCRIVVFNSESEVPRDITKEHRPIADQWVRDTDRYIARPTQFKTFLSIQEYEKIIDKELPTTVEVTMYNVGEYLGVNVYQDGSDWFLGDRYVSRPSQFDEFSTIEDYELATGERLPMDLEVGLYNNGEYLGVNVLQSGEDWFHGDGFRVKSVEDIRSALKVNIPESVKITIDNMSMIFCNWDSNYVYPPFTKTGHGQYEVRTGQFCRDCFDGGQRYVYKPKDNGLVSNFVMNYTDEPRDDMGW